MSKRIRVTEVAKLLGINSYVKIEDVIEQIIDRALGDEKEPNSFETTIENEMKEIASKTPILTVQDKQYLLDNYQLSWDELLLHMDHNKEYLIKEINSVYTQWGSWFSELAIEMTSRFHCSVYDEHKTYKRKLSPVEKIIKIHDLKMDLRNLVDSTFEINSEEWKIACIRLGTWTEEIIMKNCEGVNQKKYVRPIPGTDWYMSGCVDNYNNGVITEFKTRRSGIKSNVPKYELCQIAMYMWMSQIYRGEIGHTAVIEQHYGEEGCRTSFCWDNYRVCTDQKIIELAEICKKMDHLIASRMLLKKEQELKQNLS